MDFLQFQPNFDNSKCQFLKELYVILAGKSKNSKNQSKIIDFLKKSTFTGSETEERVRRIASWLDPEIEESALLFPSFGGHDFRAYCQFYLCVDGKITRM